MAEDCCSPGGLPTAASTSYARQEEGHRADLPTRHAVPWERAAVGVLQQLNALDRWVGLVPPRPRAWRPEDGPLVRLHGQHVTLWLAAGSALLGGALASVAGLMSGEWGPGLVFVVLTSLLAVLAVRPPAWLARPVRQRLDALPDASAAPRADRRPALRASRVAAVVLPLLFALPAVMDPNGTLMPLATTLVAQLGMLPWLQHRWERDHDRVLLVARRPRRMDRGLVWSAPDGGPDART